MKRKVVRVEIRLAGQKSRRVIEADNWLRVQGFYCQCADCMRGGKP